MKQTAVEWLLEQLKINNYISDNAHWVIDEAKEMEEQNTIEILESYHNSLFHISLKEGEAKEILKHIKNENTRTTL